jgi:hypothetical protein
VTIVRNLALFAAPFMFIFFWQTCSALSEKVYLINGELRGRLSGLNFVVNLAERKRIFEDSLWGIDVISIIQNDIEVIPSETIINFDRINMRTITTDASIYIYNAFPEFITTKIQDGDFNKRKFFVYDLKERPKSLKIKYRVRYPDGSKSNTTYILSLKRGS